jgi:hypothetical protein
VDEQDQADALRAKHPGWQISRQFWAFRWLWEARHPGQLMPLLHKDPGGLSEAITAQEASWRQ